MFCHKCGAQIAKGAAFCHKCGTKAVYADTSQHPMDTREPIAESQQASTTDPAPTITEDTQSPSAGNIPKSNSGVHKIANIGRILMWGSLILLGLMSFGNLPISPIIPCVGVASGIILSALGTKPLGFSKIIELVSAVILLVIIMASTLSSGRTGDKYVQIVRDGTFEAYPQMTVGEAFGGFLDNPKWESGLSDDNVRFVNVTGEALYNDEEVELVIQFIVDEKSEMFHYNACEVDGTPQSPLVFWGLLEAIYGDPASSGESSSKGLDSQGNPDFISDKITIGEAQSYDNEYGNIEVTLNYATFTDKLENTLLGGYIYPDEGNVFLWADVTVRNIGTEKGSLLTAWNTLVFDGTYEFEHYTTIGDVADINPLTAPTDGALVFMVPTSIIKSDKSLVLNINDGAGEAVISYIIRAGEGTSGNGTPSTSPEGMTANDLTFRGISLTDWLEYSPDTIYDILGQPDYGTPVTGELLYGGTEFFGYTDAIAFEVYSGSISSVRVAPDGVEINGTTLSKTRTELVELLGEAAYEDNYYDESGDFRDYYFMQYVYGGGGTILRIEFPDSNSVADSIQIYRYTDGI
ncbi:zinc-ribbon domain-containing protein [Colidextribacter sp. OB.20]|uniref:zinc-ribbon domain-containing protein n=1 Tax=Colidextribacter sp. OB.20 TaxID=2304568 RepID=UPI0013686E89|nr:zinc-ribbon domain-containing protein [Colidextribacter sp. OB.20]NBI10651.1 zinc-ribbon domain-containing protein [Colidextribacter sp. OB.20]